MTTEQELSITERIAEGKAWAQEQMKLSRSDPRFRKLFSVPVWTNVPGIGGEQLGGSNADQFVKQINDLGWPVCRGHDELSPIGLLFRAKRFRSPEGVDAVIAIGGQYRSDAVLSFKDAGLVMGEHGTIPAALDPRNMRVEFDPRVLDVGFLEGTLTSAPPASRITTYTKELNALEATWDVVLYSFIAGIVGIAAAQAQKDLGEWLMRSIAEVIFKFGNPSIELQTQLEGCSVKFIFRYKSVPIWRKAYPQIWPSLQKAGGIIRAAKNTNPITILILEYDNRIPDWVLSNAFTKNGHLIADQYQLVALENMGPETSTGVLLPESEKVINPGVQTVLVADDQRHLEKPVA